MHWFESLNTILTPFFIGLLVSAGVGLIIGLEREFNTRYWGKPMTLHGVRRWLRGETLPTHE